MTRVNSVYIEGSRLKDRPKGLYYIYSTYCPRLRSSPLKVTYSKIILIIYSDKQYIRTLSTSVVENNWAGTYGEVTLSEIMSEVDDKLFKEILYNINILSADSYKEVVEYLCL